MMIDDKQYVYLTAEKSDKTRYKIYKENNATPPQVYPFNPDSWVAPLVAEDYEIVSQSNFRSIVASKHNESY